MPSASVLGRVAIVGTYHLDVIGRLSTERLLADEATEQFEFAALELDVGGTATRLAAFAREHAESVTCIGMVGDDDVGALVRDLAAASLPDVNFHFEIAAGVPTGVVSITHTSRGDRLIIGPPLGGAAKDQPPSDFAQRVRATAEHLDYVFIDGYCLLAIEARNHYLDIVAMARRTGARAVFDLVPHHADQIYSAAELREIFGRVDVVVSSLGTAAGAVGLATDTLDPPPDEVAAVSKRFGSELGAPSHILRYGKYGVGKAAVSTSGSDVTVSDTLPDGIPQPGYGDLLTLRQLSAWEETA